MKSFIYERASSPAEAAAAAVRIQGAKFIAGGTNLLDLMKLQIETPNHLIDVNGLGLDKIEPTNDGGLRIGALVRNTDLAADERVRRDYGLLSRALLAGASGQLRNMATTRQAEEITPPKSYNEQDHYSRDYYARALPLGYAMRDGKIAIVEDEAERVRLI